ncbi:rRNA pseudouridine synthase [Helicobacter didelphidarum]|uniref:Pseudouridine synthase n=1 Tax=Helicobacter didelphidarum TaxID=2040648 RepID=A0A3D8ILU0_9HELI|nr:pseudouridine synthase [Helicobacter didelphidarum]RDU66093.1 rRNA pseudouridine synthase [Helicobacter didelphidarum]
MRLNHFISKYSNYSRREADNLVQNASIKINHTLATRHTQVPDEVIKNPYKPHKNFRIFIHGKELKYKKEEIFTAIVYHKPKGELVSKRDDLGRRLIYESLNIKYKHFMPVGRLDFASEGLLILSDSKEVVRKLMESSLPRVYIIKIDMPMHKKMILAMQQGIFIQNAKAGGHHLSKIQEMEFQPMEFEIIKSGKISKLKVSLHGGQNRELRRFFAHFHANVLDLRRVSYGFINLNALPVGKTRFFTKQEYNDLKVFMQQSR